MIKKILLYILLVPTILSGQVTDTIIQDYLNIGDSSFVKRIGYYANKQIFFIKYYYNSKEIGNHKRYSEDGNILEIAIYSRDTTNNFRDLNEFNFYADDSILAYNICSYESPIKISNTDFLVSEACLDNQFIERSYRNGKAKVKIEILDTLTIKIYYFDENQEVVFSRAFIKLKTLNNGRNIWVVDGLNYIRLDDKGNELRLLYDKGVLKKLIFVPPENGETIRINKQISKIR